MPKGTGTSRWRNPSSRGATVSMWARSLAKSNVSGLVDGSSTTAPVTCVCTRSVSAYRYQLSAAVKRRMVSFLPPRWHVSQI